MDSIDITHRDIKSSGISDRQEFEKLVDLVEENNAEPEDHYEVAAIIESAGWTDARASEVFGAEDVFELAYEIFMQLKQKTKSRAIKSKEKTGFFLYTYHIIKSFLRGSIFALPMAVSVIAMLTLRFSLWSYVYLSLELATSIAIGTILSFMTVGGFMQSIARRGFLYVKQGYFYLARRIIFKFIRLGYVTCIAIAVAILLLNLFIQAFPYRMITVIVLYYFFLSSIWLSITVMYILEKELVFTGLTVLGIFVVFVFFVVLRYDIIVSQIIALTIISVLGILYVRYTFFRKELRQEEGGGSSLPRMSITLYTILPYFAYGFLYFTLLFTDRVIAWSTDDIYMPYIIWFRGQYELGLDFALLMLVIPMGFTEVIINKFMIDIDKSQKDYMAYETGSMNRRFLNMYYRLMVPVALVSAISSLIIYFAVTTIKRIPFTSIEVDLIANHVTMFVFIVALVSYAIIAIALMNAVMLFSLSQPQMAGRSTLIALAVNIVTGFLLSRWIDYYYAVFGLLAGAIVFLIFSTVMVRKVLLDLDYYLYAAA